MQKDIIIFPKTTLTTLIKRSVKKMVQVKRLEEKRNFSPKKQRERSEIVKQGEDKVGGSF